MGIVGGPHDVLRSDELPAGDPYPIIDERREDLAPEVFTRRELQRRRIEIPVLFLGLVQLLQEERKPAHLVFRRDELEIGTAPTRRRRSTRPACAALHGRGRSSARSGPGAV